MTPSSTVSPSSQSAPTQPLSGTFPLCIYFGHHKCATGWTGGTMREIAYHLGRTYRVINRPKDFRSYTSLGDFVEAHDVEILTFANASMKHARSLPPFRGIHVVRDPRDVLVSAYFSHKKTHGTQGWPELAEHRERLQSLSKSQGLRAEMEFSAPFFEDMRTWDYDQPNVLELKMENVTSRPVEAFLDIAEFLGLLDPSLDPGFSLTRHRMIALSNRWNRRGRRFMPGQIPMFPCPRIPLRRLAPRVVEEIAADRTFEKLTGRKIGQENRNTHLRKGVPGDWKNHFTPEHVRLFKEQYNDLVLSLGYEDSPDWGLA